MLSLFVLLYVLIIAIFKTIVFLYVQYLYFLIICWIKSNQIKLFQYFACKIPRPAPPPTGRPGRTQSDHTPEFGPLSKFEHPTPFVKVKPNVNYLFKCIIGCHNFNLADAKSEWHLNNHLKVSWSYLTYSKIEKNHHNHQSTIDSREKQ